MIDHDGKEERENDELSYHHESEKCDECKYSGSSQRWPVLFRRSTVCLKQIREKSDVEQIIIEANADYLVKDIPFAGKTYSRLIPFVYLYY